MIFLLLFFSFDLFAAKLPVGALIDEETLEKLIKHKSYEKAFRALPRLKVEQSKNPHYAIVYDLLHVKLKKRSVKELLCKEDNKKDPDAYTYPGLLCDLLIDYLDDGKIEGKNLHIVEEYFLKHDQKKFYLFHLARELKN
jgi:hypothetical protein